MKILILIPGENARGGITNYYSSLRKHLPENIVYFKRGSRNWPKKANFLIEISRIIADYIRFIYTLITKRISVVQTTTAFYKGSIIRDGLFLVLAMLFRKKTIVFFRGWDDNFAHKLSGLKLKLFKAVYFKADAIIDLSESNIFYLKKLGYKKEIYLETTLVDESLIKGVEIDKVIKDRNDNDVKTILFLSRIDKKKGIFDILEIYSELKKRNPNYKLIFAGDGLEIDELKNKIKESNIQDVQLMGFVGGKEKQKVFKKASLFLFLSKVEGMPNAVLEAMAFGLPVVTTNIGGIASVFKNKQNGILIENFYYKGLIDKIEYILNDRELYFKIGKNNYNEAKQKFWSNHVSERLMLIFDKVETQ